MIERVVVQALTTSDSEQFLRNCTVICTLLGSSSHSSYSLAMSNEERNAEDWRTAVHEAGHAVAHVRLASTFYLGNVTIIPDGHRAGCGQFEELWTESADDWRNEVVVLCAGYAAAVVFGHDRRTARHGARSDFDKASAIIAAWNMRPLREHIRVAEKLIERPENRKAVRAIAEGLIEVRTVSGEWVEVVIEWSDGQISDEDYARFLSFVGMKPPAENH